MEASLQTTEDIPSRKQLFMPQETRDHPFDVTLVVENGKQFKAHRRVLSEASPFFEKLLSSGMRESKEGVVRLQMLTELCLRDILEFIYTGSVQISAEDNAQELIAMADYLDLPHLKTLAEEVLLKNLKLKISNYVSTYYLAERYRCEELISDTKNFILTNFTTVAKTDEFLNLPSKEVKMWISSDEIDVSAEEDVFKIILTWIDREKSERKKYFPELFREVRLVYVSRDFLHRDIVTNDLVNDYGGCMDLVKHAMKLVDSKDLEQFSVKPRKSLETPVIVVCVKCVGEEDQKLCCYHPHKDIWSRFPDTLPPKTERVISCHGKLYFVSQRDSKLYCYDSFSNCWTSLPYEEQRKLHQLFVRHDNEIYALVSEDQESCSVCVSFNLHGIHSSCGKKHLSFLMKYKPALNLWEDISSLDLGSRIGICVVAKDNFIYFLGGYAENRFETLADADRFDLSTNTWHKIADLQEPRQNACGAAAYGNIYIAGGVNRSYLSESCEVYLETTNEWQFIARLKKAPMSDYSPTLLCVDNMLYLLTRYIYSCNTKYRMGCLYELDGNEWSEKTQIPNEKMFSAVRALNKSYFITFSCSMRVFKGCNFLQQALFPDKVGKNKCALM